MAKVQQNSPGAKHHHTLLRVQSLMAMGEPEPPRNPDHPQLYCRKAIAQAERKLGLFWNGRARKHLRKRGGGQ